MCAPSSRTRRRLRHTQVNCAVPAGDRPVMGFGVLCRQLRRPLLAGRALEREWCAPLSICDGFRCSCGAVWLLCVACWVIGGRVSGAVPVVQTASVTWTCDAPERLDGPPVHTHTVGHTDSCTAEYRILVLGDSHRPNTQGMLGIAISHAMPKHNRYQQCNTNVRPRAAVSHAARLSCRAPKWRRTASSKLAGPSLPRPSIVATAFARLPSRSLLPCAALNPCADARDCLRAMPEVSPA